MPSENVHLLQNFNDAWNRGDFAGCIASISSDWEYRTTEFFLGIDPVYRGEEGFTRFWSTFRGAWESFTVEFKRVEDLGDVVLALQMVHGKGKGSAIEVFAKVRRHICVPRRPCRANGQLRRRLGRCAPGRRADRDHAAATPRLATSAGPVPFWWGAPRLLGRHE
jgi:hypothetical protein